MGEIPLEINVTFPDGREETLVVYYCKACETEFLIAGHDYLSHPTCPVCGSTEDAKVEIEFT